MVRQVTIQETGVIDYEIPIINFIWICSCKFLIIFDYFASVVDNEIPINTSQNTPKY